MSHFKLLGLFLALSSLAMAGHLDGLVDKLKFDKVVMRTIKDCSLDKIPAVSREFGLTCHRSSTSWMRMELSILTLISSLEVIWECKLCRRRTQIWIEIWRRSGRYYQSRKIWYRSLKESSQKTRSEKRRWLHVGKKGLEIRIRETVQGFSHQKRGIVMLQTVANCVYNCF